MSKKMKLNLDGLKVQSFVTSLDDDKKKDAKGGHITLSCGTACENCPQTFECTLSDCSWDMSVCFTCGKDCAH